MPLFDERIELLSIEPNEISRERLLRLTANGDANSTAASGRRDAVHLLNEYRFDCLLFDVDSLGSQVDSGMEHANLHSPSGEVPW
jgi:hypothetical protein